MSSPQDRGESRNVSEIQITRESRFYHGRSGGRFRGLRSGRNISSGLNFLICLGP